MSRSYRKPTAQFCCGSDTLDKIIARRAVRRKQNEWLRNTENFDSSPVPHKLECRNNDRWGWSTDGGTYRSFLTSRDWSNYRKALSEDEPFREFYAEYYSNWPPAWYVKSTRK